jgi:hypothetical protein
MKSFLESLVSEQTRRSYKRGLAKFEEYYGKSSKFLLEEKDPRNWKIYESLRRRRL